MHTKWTVLVGVGGALGSGAPGLTSALGQPEGAAGVTHAAEPAPAQPGVGGRGESTADHSTFEVLQQDFKTGPEVTAACLTCHTDAAQQLMKTSHWTWLSTDQTTTTATGEAVPFGKAARVINNFCIAVPGNEPRCTSCHIGYGWKDSSFDFSNQNLVDCLVCHDSTGKYKKFPTAAGHPVYADTPDDQREWPKGSGKLWEPAPLREIAQSVSTPSRQNCGECHFFGGGGEGVKHGDMDESLATPSLQVDVHMSPDGADMHCIACHTTHSHKVSGRYYEQAAYDERSFVLRGSPHESNLLACESCHTQWPHQTAAREGKDVKNAARLDAHQDRVSCQACHIPTLARERPTKMWWDWSKGGEKNEDGTPKKVMVDTKGTKTPQYDMQKGEFIWVIDENPEYRWFNGNTKQIFIDTKIDDTTPGRDRGKVTGQWSKIDLDKPIADINILLGDANDPKSRIWPVKVHRGIQPYDAVNKNLVAPKLFPGAGDKAAAYWKGFDWEKATEAGMKENNAPYSGQLGWIQTEMNWPLAHMVAPAEDAVGCVECHSTNGRLAGLEGLYIPGRDRNMLVEYAGMGLIGLTLLGALSHGALRVLTSGRRK